ncbi:hypothetical protein [Sphaerimonospora mesophila]|uniref:hypothetical protein n=1 Tax=Sphaerimonospora mesophila TaxID=37483 RepID=UPI0006E4283E
MSDAYSPFHELNLLKEFQDRLEGRSYAGDFTPIDHGERIRGLDDPDLKERLIFFAHATGAPSLYALWRCDDREDRAALPVIFCGDEGEIFIETASPRDLLRILTLDVAHINGAELEEEDHTEAHHEYLAWLDENFGLKPFHDPAPIHKTAFEQYGRPFAEWWLQREPGYASLAEMLQELACRWRLGSAPDGPCSGCGVPGCEIEWGKTWTMHHFSQANPKGPGQGDGQAAGQASPGAHHGRRQR